jgi:tRNA A37 threonylcarbamoyladenosine modification protein TsaB
MKTINIALTDKAHSVLKSLTEKNKKNQSDVISDMLENLKLETNFS